MGISGLLSLLKSIHKPCSLKKFAGKTIGVDVYGWLHRGAATCPIELALDKPTTKVVDFAMNRVRMLIHFGITPYLVFDGDNLPSKAGTEEKRRDKRKEAKRLGMELLKMGKTSLAHQELQKAVDVTAEMARQLIEELKHHNIQYVVAPYEADSQLAYLEKQGIIDGILSEDSDLLVFGAKCLITKLDKYGECIEVNRNLFTACREISLAGWSDADFRRMAILSGCDYLPSIGKMGLKTAHRMLRKYKTVDRVVKTAQFDGQFKVPSGYIEAFYQAENTFLYQWVFCPQTNGLVNLTKPGQGVDVSNMAYIGARVPDDTALGVARGDLNPRTKKPIIIEVKERRFSKPLVPSRRVSAIVQTPDSKQGKPIDAFFKSKRTPLAELDPNSFTPSPRQQALLQQNSGNSWVAALAPGSQSATQVHVPRTAPQPARRSISERWDRRASAPHPVKRQRLCSDSEFETPALSRTQTERSPFFASSVADPSPSLKKGKKKSNQEFDLWSDASVEDAMAELVDLEEAASQSRKVPIFRDDYRSDVNSGSQSTTFSRSITERSQDTIGTLTPATSFGSPPPDAEEFSISSVALSSQVNELRSKFSFNSTTANQESSHNIGLARIGLGKRSRRSSSEHGADFLAPTHVSLPSNISTKTSRVKGTDGNLEDSAWAAMEAEVVVAASSPAASPPSTHKKPEIRGSEDLLVPDSDAESNCSPRKPILNLGQFAFAG
ncbi:exonuclease-like protein [Lojkania enalia]|uniref:Exonuclease-like protein n=1 Tax=Lojkania enalia TaxID=147567 RepID=A0A9P4K2M4_9PLEO|nr:exonuclease-like protein [Didymosphaeria enalia]